MLMFPTASVISSISTAASAAPKITKMAQTGKAENKKTVTLAAPPKARYNREGRERNKREESESTKERERPR